MRPFGPITDNDMRNEIRAIDKLCGENSHHNLVRVLRHGLLFRSSLSYYFIDMELCDMDLNSYIIAQKALADSNSLPSVEKTLEAVLKILKEINAGLEFIHGHGEVHRDLKPSNGPPNSYRTR